MPPDIEIGNPFDVYLYGPAHTFSHNTEKSMLASKTEMRTLDLGQHTCTSLQWSH